MVFEVRTTPVVAAAISSRHAKNIYPIHALVVVAAQIGPPCIAIPAIEEIITHIEGGVHYCTIMTPTGAAITLRAFREGDYPASRGRVDRAANGKMVVMHCNAAHGIDMWAHQILGAASFAFDPLELGAIKATFLVAVFA